MTEPQTTVTEPTGEPTTTVESQNPEQTPQTVETPTPPADEPAPESDPQTSEESNDNPEPESFEFTVPETMTLTEDTTAKLGEVAQQLGVSADHLQQLLDAVAPSLVEGNESMLRETREAWAAEVANDPLLGGQKLNENMAIADKAVDTFGDEGLRELLSAEGLPLGKNPAVFRFLVKIGAAISDDRTVNPGNNGKPAPQPISGDVFQDTDRAASIMYPNEKK